MSIGSILNAARSGMNAQQIAVQIASQNISNAQTEGYSRQRVEMATSLTTVYPFGVLGTGVDIKTISRARDSLLDATYRADAGNQTQAETTSTALSQIQDIFAEPSDSGLSAALDQFWSSWTSLANDPTNGAAKAAVRVAGGTVASTLNRFASQLDQLDQSNRIALNADVGQVNTLTKQVADYNRQIVAAESGGHVAGDLRDARDRLIDQLSTLTGGSAIERSNGNIAFYVGSRMVVDGTMTKTLEATDGQPPTVTFSGDTTPIAGFGGRIGAELDVSGNQVPSVMSKLDAMASTLVQTVNAIHSSGVAYSGNPPVATPAGNFFQISTPSSAGDPFLTARGISLDSTLTSPDSVAAAAASTGPGNNAVALQLANLRTQVLPVSSAGGTSFGNNAIGDFYSSIVSGVATDVRNADDNATVQKTLADNANTRRQSVSAVSTDDELISVIQHQHSYQAAARLVSVVDEMTQTLVDLGR
jgi:flagellar hook-associated protein 1 FlgK